MSKKLLIAVTNFEMSDEADMLKAELLKVGKGRYDLSLIDSSSNKRPAMVDKVVPNGFYQGLWNESASMAIEGGYENLFFIASDIQTNDYQSLSDMVLEAAVDHKIGVYTPSLQSGSRFAYDQCLRRNSFGTRDCEWVEGFCFLAKTEILKRLFPVTDNKYGWQVDRATCLTARKMGLRVVVDDRIEIFHPASQKRIDRKAALEMGKAYFEKIKNDGKSPVSPTAYTAPKCSKTQKSEPIRDAVAIVTSVKMDDYLRVTIKNNRSLFGEYYVLTSPDDEATDKLCSEFDAKLLSYDRFFDVPKCSFNKSGGLRQAQRFVHEKHRAKWVVLMDADIMLPEQMRDIDTSKFTKRWLYGMERVDVHSHEDYLGKRFHKYRDKFCGYFQMYHNKSALYPPVSRNASWCDIAFRDIFPRRILIPDMHLVHIGRSNSHWNGREGKRLEWGDS